MKTIIIGYGNPDRQDDGVAWHVMCALAQRLGLNAPTNIDDEFQSGSDINFIFQLQLTPELAEDISNYPLACFVDAHTGAIPQEVNAEVIDAHFQKSPFTHHMTPQTLLSMCQSLYQKAPKALLVSIRGYRFGFSDDLSEQTRELVPQAAGNILEWIQRN
ncbi:MAG: hydrogenase maturation protease [Anaerolineales bacterium]|nr:hydrogenase maturation protease [Anaerolineales bacterium]